MQPLQTENRQPGIEAEVQDNTDRLLAPQQLTEPALQAMPTAGARHFLLTFLLPSGQKVRRLSGRDPTVLSRQNKESIACAAAGRPSKKSPDLYEIFILFLIVLTSCLFILW
jgi:hypothetical protein